MTLHGLEADYYEDVRHFSGVLDAVIATNRLAHSLTSRHGGLEPSRTLYAPYGVAEPATHPHPPEALQRTLTIGYAGRLEQSQKRVLDLPDILHKAVDSGRRIRFLVAGSGPERRRLEAALAACPADLETHFLGHLTPDRLRGDFYDQIDALLITSSWETGPIVAWEAMANGAVVVSSRYLGSRCERALRHGETALLFPVGDVDEAAAQLVRIESHELRRRLGAAGRRLVAERYTIDRSVAAWHEALRSVLANPPREPAPHPPPVKPAGRLDRWLGLELAESLRAVTGRQGFASSAGDEWPHSLGALDPYDPDFWRLAELVDASSSGGPLSEA